MTVSRNRASVVIEDNDGEKEREREKKRERGRREGGRETNCKITSTLVILAQHKNINVFILHHKGRFLRSYHICMYVCMYVCMYHLL